MNYTGIKKIVIFVLMAVLVVGCSKDTGPWPKSKLAEGIPKPSSQEREISIDTDQGFMVYVTNVSAEEYDKYADKCYEAGFTENYKKTDSGFRGVNKDGIALGLNYNPHGEKMTIICEDRSSE